MNILLFGKTARSAGSCSAAWPCWATSRRWTDSTDHCGDFANPEGIAATVRACARRHRQRRRPHRRGQGRERARLARLLNATTPGVLAARPPPGRLAGALQHRLRVRRQRHPPWVETDTPAERVWPHQARGEQLIQQRAPHLIFRTSWVYAARGGNFAKTMLRLAQERERLTVIDDQWGAPTGAELLADVTAHAIRHLQQRRRTGLYHLVAAARPPGMAMQNS
jgi:dTDP-4-dehydrorhamnose reductase